MSGLRLASLTLLFYAVAAIGQTGNLTVVGEGGGGAGDVTQVGACTDGPCFSLVPERTAFLGPTSGAGAAAFRALLEADISDLDHCIEAPADLYFVGPNLQASCPYCDSSRCFDDVQAAVDWADLVTTPPVHALVVISPGLYLIDSLVIPPFVDLACSVVAGPSTSIYNDAGCRLRSSQATGQVVDISSATIANVSFELDGTPAGDVSVIHADFGWAYLRNVTVHLSQGANPHRIVGAHASGSGLAGLQAENLNVFHYLPGSPNSVSVLSEGNATVKLELGWLNDHGSTIAAAIRHESSTTFELFYVEIGASTPTYGLILDCDAPGAGACKFTGLSNIHPSVGNLLCEDCATADGAGKVRLAGDLTGSADAPEVAPDAVAMGVDTTGAFVAGSTSGGGLEATGGAEGASIGVRSDCADGQILKRVSGVWECAADDSGSGGGDGGAPGGAGGDVQTHDGAGGFAGSSQFRFLSNQVLIPSGTTAAPGLAFGAAPGTGFVLGCAGQPNEFCITRLGAFSLWHRISPTAWVLGVDDGLLLGSGANGWIASQTDSDTKMRFPGGDRFEAEPGGVVVMEWSESGGAGGVRFTPTSSALPCADDARGTITFFDTIGKFCGCEGPAGGASWVQLNGGGVC